MAASLQKSDLISSPFPCSITRHSIKFLKLKDLRVPFSVSFCQFSKAIILKTYNEIVLVFLPVESKTNTLYVNINFTGNLFFGFGRYCGYIFHKNELFWIKLILLKIENYYWLWKMQTPLCTEVFLEALYKISRETGKAFWYWRSGNMTTYYFYLFCFQFTIKILLTLPLI